MYYGTALPTFTAGRYVLAATYYSSTDCSGTPNQYSYILDSTSCVTTGCTVSTSGGVTYSSTVACTTTARPTPQPTIAKPTTIVAVYAKHTLKYDIHPQHMTPSLLIIFLVCFSSYPIFILSPISLFFWSAFYHHSSLLSYPSCIPAVSLLPSFKPANPCKPPSLLPSLTSLALTRPQSRFCPLHVD